MICWNLGTFSEHFLVNFVSDFVSEYFFWREHFSKEIVETFDEEVWVEKN